MTNSEIMNCAAILAAGLMSSQGARINYNTDDAVEMMVEIADKLGKALRSDEEIDYRQV